MTDRCERSIVAAPEAGGRPAFLVCPPDHFDAHYLFNPWMSYRDRIDLRRAKGQWRRLVRTLEEAGADVHVMEPSPLTGALPFTADGALCYAPGRALVLRNDGLRGDLEPPLFTRWFRSHGYEVEALPPRYRLDGGNLVRLPDGRLLAGLKPRAGGLAERYLARLLRLTTGRHVWALPLVDRRYMHLDTALGVLDSSTFLVYLDGFEGGQLPNAQPLADADIIPVDTADAQCFACNVVVVGDVVITGPISRKLERRIARAGYHVERVALDEFYKAGGGAKCLTLPLVHHNRGEPL